MSIDVPHGNGSLDDIPSDFDNGGATYDSAAADVTGAPVDVDAAFAEVVARREERLDAEAADDHAVKSLWLAHHWPHKYERCAVIAGRHVCRRCLWFYSISLTVFALAFASLSPWPEAWDPYMVWALSIPATAEFIGGELGAWKYNPRRQIAVTSILALAVGRGFFRNVQDQFTWVFWGPAIVFGLLWFVTGLYAWSKNKGQYRD